ncbi:MAG: hypothetical protein WB760_25715 [Xanthobacteraceae bacterium]
MKRDRDRTNPLYSVMAEKEVDVPVRDGVGLKADVFRPDGADNS